MAEHREERFCVFSCARFGPKGGRLIYCSQVGAQYSSSCRNSWLRLEVLKLNCRPGRSSSASSGRQPPRPSPGTGQMDRTATACTLGCPPRCLLAAASLRQHISPPTADIARTPNDTRSGVAFPPVAPRSIRYASLLQASGRMVLKTGCWGLLRGRHQWLTIMFRPLGGCSTRGTTTFTRPRLPLQRRVHRIHLCRPPRGPSQRD